MALDIQDLIRQREESRQMRADPPNATPTPEPAQLQRRTTATRRDIEPEWEPKPKQAPPAKPTIKDRLRIHKAVAQYRNDPIDDEPENRKPKRSRLHGIKTFLFGCVLIAFPSLGAILSVVFAVTRLKGESDYFLSVQALHISQAFICLELIVIILYFEYWKRAIQK